MFVFCCKEAHPLKRGEKRRCPVCGKELKLPKAAETIGTLEKEEDPPLNDPPTSLKK